MVDAFAILSSDASRESNPILTPVYADMMEGVAWWEDMKLVRVLFGGIEAEKIHPWQRTTIDNLNPSKDLLKCVQDFLIIDFPWTTACSLTEWGAGSYTLRGWIAEGTFDRLPSFTAIAYIKIDPDGTIHTERASCTIPAEQDKMDIQFREVCKKLQPDENKIRYDVQNVLEEKLIYRDVFGSVYYDGRNSSWDHVYILQSHSSESGCFRCELNTYINTEEVMCIYAGSFINRENGFGFGNVLWWIAVFIQNSIWESDSAWAKKAQQTLCERINVLLQRDSSKAHAERKNEFSLHKYFRMFANLAPKSGNNTYPNTFVQTSFPGVFHSQESIWA